MKLYVTTVNNSFQLLPNFCHKELNRRCCIELRLIIQKNSKRYLGAPTPPPPPMIEWNLRKIWKTCSPRCPKIHFQRFFALSFKHLISNGLNWVNNNSLMLIVAMWICGYKFLCSIFSKGTQRFDFIRRNVIQKLASKVKYIFGNLRIRFFKISWLDREQLWKE